MENVKGVPPLVFDEGMGEGHYMPILLLGENLELGRLATFRLFQELLELFKRVGGSGCRFEISQVKC